MRHIPAAAQVRALTELVSARDPIRPLLEWTPAEIREFLVWHKVLPTALSLASRSSEPHDPSILKFIEGGRIRHSFGVGLLLDELKRLHDGLSGAGIAYQVMKGDVWRSQTYPAGVDRHAGDIDLLVLSRSRDAAIRVIEGLGYRPETSRDMQRDLETRGEVMLLKDTKLGPVAVEVHWHPIPSRRFMRDLRISAEDFFEQERSVDYHGMTLGIPRPEVRFTYLLAHAGCQHQYRRFLGLVDLAWLLRAKGGDMDWRLVRDLVNRWGATQSLWLGARLLAAFSVRFPDLDSHAAEVRAAIPLHLRGILDLLTPRLVALSYRGSGGHRRKLVRWALSRPIRR